MSQELGPLPEARLWYDPETQRCSSMAPLRPTYEPLWDEGDMRAYAAAAVAAEREQERIASRAREDDAYVCGREDERKRYTAPVVKPAAIVRSIEAGEVRLKWMAGFPQIGDRLYYAAHKALYTADQMRAYAAEQVAAERERCAKLVETQDTNGDNVGGWFEMLAAKIRA